MNRRRFLRQVGITAASAKLLSPSASAREIFPPSTTAPVLLNPAPDGVSIVCVFNIHVHAWIEYGETESLGKRCDASSLDGLRACDDYLIFRLTDLKPGQRYFYRMCLAPLSATDPFKTSLGETSATGLYSFRTLDHGANEISFTVWNDTHENVPTLERLITDLRAQPTDFLFWNGDIFNDVRGKQEVFEQCFRFGDAAPFFMTRGNHDVRGTDARLLPRYVNGPHGQYYYTFRHGPVGFLVLDTGEDKPDDDPSYAGLVNFADYRAAQAQWLAEAIKEPSFASAPIRVAFLHIPLVWEADVPEHWPKIWNGHKGWITEDGFRKWNDLLTQAGVKLVISGHTHRHAWFPANDKHAYGQLIGGGPQPEQATVIRVKADARRLSFEVRDLQGKVVREGEVTA